MYALGHVLSVLANYQVINIDIANKINLHQMQKFTELCVQ